MQDLPPAASKRTRAIIEQDIAWHRTKRDAEREAGHEAPVRWHEQEVDDLLGQWLEAPE